jgi:hypothetical protein
MRAIDSEGHESKYNFAGNKNLKTVFYNWDWFDPNQGTRENEFGIVEVKHAHRLRGCDPFTLPHQVEQVYYMSYVTPQNSEFWNVTKIY